MRFESNRDFVNWVQDRLGPYAPRPVAEDVAYEFLVTRRIDEKLSMSNTPDEEEIKRIAKAKMEAREIAAKRGGRGAAKARAGKVRGHQKTRIDEVNNQILPDGPDGASKED